MRTPDRTWKRPSPTPRQRVHDLWFGAIAAVVSVLSLELWRSMTGQSIPGPDWAMYLAFGVVGGLLAGRRSWPLPVLLAEAVLFIVIGEVQPLFSAVFTVQMALFMALYTAWAWSRHTRALYVISALVVTSMFGWLLVQFIRERPEPGAFQLEVGMFDQYWATVAYSLIINVAYFFGAMAWGYVAWRDARRQAEISAQREREQQAREREQEGAIRDERVRIARDLHDVVAHHVSGIGVQAAGAARVMASRPDDALRALDTIETSSRTAVTQMHQLVGLLRDGTENSDRSPQPGLQELHELVSADGRPTVEFEQVGEAFDVPATVQLSLVRMAQEAVANVRRHARSADHAKVSLRYLDDRRNVEVEVIDNGRGAIANSPNGGFGLRGIRERAEMHRGECEIGPRPAGGFRVRVRIPVE